jgi:pimeloyl-ACP methyl ester carboxylesterase
MFKPLFVSLAVTTACAGGNGAPAASGGETMSANSKPEQQAVAFTSSKDGTKIAFEKSGRGPALVIVGGALSDRNGGKPLAGKLQDHFTVYTYDRRGRGESGDTKPYAVDREIEDLESILQQAGGQANVYGVSSGAALALQAAAKLGPDRVAKLAVYEPPYGQDEGDFKQQKERINQIVETGKPGDAASFFLSAIGMPPQAVDEMKRSPQWEGMSKIDFTLAYDFAVLGNGAVPDTVERISAPTLVMNGEKSMPFIQPTADRLGKSIPNSRRKTLPGQTHQAAPEAVAPLLIEFFGSA